VLSIFAKFTRNLTDPRVDGNGSTVYFNVAESYQLLVRQGAESAGTPTPPALDPEYILIADVVRRNPQAAIVDGDIVDNVSYGAPPALSPRREAAFAFSAGSMLVRERTAEASDLAVLNHLNDHLTDTVGAHAGTAISFASTGNWANGATISAGTLSTALNEVVADLASVGGSACVGFTSGVQVWSDGSTISSLNVQGALQEVISDLASQVAAQSGARKIGVEARTAWLGGRTNPAAGLYAAVDKIITDLGANTATDDGAERVGAAASGNLLAGSVRSQLDELDAEKGGLALANTWTATNTFSETIVVNGATASPTDPAIQTTQLPSGTGSRKLLWEFPIYTSGTVRFARIYAYGDVSGAGKGFEIALNASWNPSTSLWSLDDTTGGVGNAATIFRFGPSGFDSYQHDQTGGNTWADLTSGPNWHKRLELRIPEANVAGTNQRSTSITVGGNLVSDMPCTLQGGICATTGAVGVGNDALGGYSPYEHIFPSTPSSITTFTTLQSFNAGATFSQVTNTRTVRGVSIENNAVSSTAASVHWTALVS
jgi:hypothetical protein